MLSDVRDAVLDGGKPILSVCVTCGKREDGTVQGEELHGRLKDYASAGHFELREARCLASCRKNTAGSVSMPGRWSLLLGHLTPDLAQDLAAFTTIYAASKTGAVMPSKRPETLRDVILGRIPPQDGFQRG